MAEKSSYEKLERRIQELERMESEYKSSQKALKESEEKYRILFEHTSEALFVAQNGRIVFQNSRSKELTGYSAEEFQTRPFIEFIHKDDREMVIDRHLRRIRGENPPKRYAFRIIHKSGTILWAELNAVMIQWNGKPATLNFMSDITERKQAEDALIESEALFRGMFKDHSAVMLLIDPDTGQIIKANNAAVQYYGYPLEKMLQMKIQQLNILSPERTIEQMQYALNQQINIFEFRHLMADGQVRDIEVHFAPIAIQHQKLLFSIIRDITEHKKAEATLYLREKDLNKSQRIAHLGSWYLDVATDQVTWSEELYKMFGFDPTLPPPPYTEHMKLFTAESWDRLCVALSNTKDTGVPYELELETVKEDGSNGWMWVRGEATNDSDGNTISLWGASQDITERKQAEQTLKESEERFRNLMENIDTVAIQGYGPDGTTQYWNKASERLYGYSQKEAIGCNLLDLIIPFEMKDEVAKAIREMAESGQPIPTGKLLLMHKNGSRVPVISHHAIVRVPRRELELFCFDVDITDRKIAEEILRAEREQLLSVFNSIDEVIYISDPSTYEILYVNKFLQNQLTSDCIGAKCYKIFQNLDAPCSFCTNDIILKQKPEPYNWEFYNKNLDRHYAIVDRIIRWSDGRDVRFEMAKDITEHKRIEDALTQQLGFEQAIVKASRFLLSAETTELAVTQALKSLAESSGFSRNYIFENFNDPEDGLCMRQVFEVCAPGVPPEIGNPILQHMVYSQGFKRWQKVLSTGKPIQGDVRDFPEIERDVLEPQGIVSILIIPINVGGRWWGFIGFDKTSSQHRWKDSEVALLQTVSEMIGAFFMRKENDRKTASLAAVVENSNDIVVVKDLDLRVIATNQAFAIAAGHATVDTMIGKTDAEIFGLTPETEPIHSYMEDERRAQMLPPGQFILREEPVVTSAGKRHTVLTKKYPIYDSSQKLIGTGNISIDITKRKLLEAQLAQAQKMESVGRLAGGVAHDFNNMLGVILGHAELALEKAEDNPDLYFDLKEIQSAAQRSANLTKQLLTYARKQIIEPKMLNLNQTVKQMITMLQRLIGEDINLIWKPAETLWPIKMDPSQVDQILANLCVNARDAIVGVGKLTIETGMVSFDEAYCVDHPGFIPGDFVLIGVSDDGCGMDKETLNNLFEPFFTTKETGKGTGLGLATVYGIVKQNNGFINVYSEPGQGTTFRVYLPRYSTADETPAVIYPEKPDPTGNETILLVEDEPAILNMTRMMLERKGYSVLSAATPAEAIRIAEKYEGKIQLLMTDVVMPEMNGRNLAMHLTGLHPDIKVLFMSGYTANVIAHQGILDEGVAFIQKPFSLKDLAGMIRKVLDIKE